MRKKIIIAITLLFIFLLGAYFWLLSVPGNDKGSVDSSTAPAKLAEEIEEELGFSGSGNLNSLLERGESAECKIWYENDSVGEVEGTVFVDGANIRGDFVSESPDLSGEIVTSFIITETDMHYWSLIEGEMYGVKGSLENSDDDPQTPISPEENVRYECSHWLNVDRSVFVPPADVTWTDLDSAGNPVMEYGTIYEEGAPEF